MKKRKNIIKWKTPTKWAMFGLIMGVVLATVGSIGAFNGWFGGGGSVPSDTLTRGLVGYWAMEDGSGAIAYDSSNYANHGTLTYMSTSTNAWTKGKVGGALSFDGTDDAVVVSSPSAQPIGSADRTIELWVKPTSFTNIQYLVVQGVFLESQMFAIFLRDGTGEFEMGTHTHNLDTDWNLTLNVWTHLVVTLSGGNYVSMYANGELKKAGTITATANTSNTKFYIGARTDDTNFASAYLDDVRIYNRALSAAEIRYHYNRGGPVAHWKFDEGEGRTAYDSTDNNNDGTLVLAGSATSSAWAAGKSGSALSFDGVDDYVDAGNISSNARTVSFWLKRGDTSDKDVIDLGTPEIKITSNAITSTGLTSPTYYVNAIPNTTAVSSANQWYHIAITDTADINASNVDIGKASTNFFNGLIDDVRIYNYARTPEEIRLDYNAGFAARFGPQSDCKRDPGACMTQGLVGYWAMEEGVGGNAYDASNYGNNGTLTSGPAWTKGKVGSSLSFDGSNDYVGVNHNASLNFGTGSFSFEFWIKRQGNWTDNIYAGILGKINYHPEWAGSFGWVLEAKNNSSIYFWARSSGGTTPNWDSGVTVSVPLDQWAHIVFVADRNGSNYTQRVYKDSVLQSSQAFTVSGTFDNSQSLKLWASGGSGANYIVNAPGLLDEVRIYSQAMTTGQIQKRYAESLERYQNLAIK